MKASKLIKLLEQNIRYYGDKEVSCVAGHSFFETDWVSYSEEDDEIQIECKA